MSFFPGPLKNFCAGSAVYQSITELTLVNAVATVDIAYSSSHAKTITEY